MTAAIVIIAVFGVILGLGFRASALAAGSILVLAFSVLHSVANGQIFLSGIAISLGLLATLQAGYLLGLAFSSFLRTRKHSQHPHSGDFTPTKSAHSE